MPLQKPLPKPPIFKMAPLVMYSQAKSPTPSTTAIAPEFLTAKRSPASPLIKNLPPVAPNRAKFPINTLLPGVFIPPPGDSTTKVPPQADLPTPSLQVPKCSMRIPSFKNAA